MHAKGHSPEPATFFGEPDGVRHISSDTAFWRRTAFQGNYDGFRVIDISDPDNPAEISHPSGNGAQGDIVVWDNNLVRAWNSKKSTDRLCDGQTVPAGFEACTSSTSATRVRLRSSARSCCRAAYTP